MHADSVPLAMADPTMTIRFSGLGDAMRVKSRKVCATLLTFTLFDIIALVNIFNSGFVFRFYILYFSVISYT